MISRREAIKGLGLFTGSTLLFTQLSVGSLVLANDNLFSYCLNTIPISLIGCNVKWGGKDKHWMPADVCDLIF